MTLMKSLKSAVLGTLVLTATASLANAADIYQSGSVKDDTPYTTPYIGWTGFYVGGHLGGAWDNTENVELFDDAILAGGVHLGYNWETPSHIVAGLETDVSFLDDVDYLSTIRARIGYANGPALAYLTGGVAFIGLNDEVFGDETETGWVAGAGLEYKLRDNWSIGGEALYYGFEDPADIGEDADFWVARARLTYHIGSGYSLLK